MAYEVFYISDEEKFLFEVDEAGWYWWTCQAGCLPDSEALGPYQTKQRAEEAAKEG